MHFLRCTEANRIEGTAAQLIVLSKQRHLFRIKHMAEEVKKPKNTTTEPTPKPTNESTTGADTKPSTNSATTTEKKSLSAKTKGVLATLLSLAGLGLGLYSTSQPYLEVNHIPAIDCPTCGTPELRLPPTAPSNSGATISVTVDNSGAAPTTITDHNESFQIGEPTGPLNNTLIEQPDPADKTEVPVGAHSFRILRMPVAALAIDLLRNPVPVGSSWGPRRQDKAFVFGHVRYRRYWWPTTMEYCFQYVPTEKGLPESWTICPSEIHVRRTN